MNVAGTLNVVTAARDTLDICDRVVVIVGGRLDAVETLEDLPLRNAYFRSAKHGVGWGSNIHRTIPGQPC